MTKKKIIALSVSIVVIIAIVLTIVLCIPRPVFKNGPSATDAAVGNGGMAVSKGEYVYFVNGYKSKTEKNSGNKIEQGAIYRVKSNNASFVVSGDELLFNSGSLVSSEETGSLVGAERLVSKIAGFENTKLFIFDETLYFTSPSTTKNLASGATNTDFVDVFSIKLNGLGLEKLYTIENFKNGQINFYKNGKDVYGIFYDGADELAIFKNGKKEVEKTSVTSLMMPSFNEDFSEMNVTNEQRISYVVDGKLEILSFPNTQNNEITYQTLNIENTAPKLVAVKNNKLFYEATYAGASTASLYMLDISQKVISYFENQVSRCVANATFGNYVVLDEIDTMARIAVLSDTTLKVFTQVSNRFNPTDELTIEASSTLLFATKTGVVYKTDTALYVVELFSKESKKVTESAVKFFENPASFDGTFLYYFIDVTNKEGTYTYFERANVGESQNDGKFETQELSNRLEDHFKDKEEDKDKV